MLSTECEANKTCTCHIIASAGSKFSLGRMDFHLAFLLCIPSLISIKHSRLISLTRKQITLRLAIAALVRLRLSKHALSTIWLSCVLTKIWCPGPLLAYSFHYETQKYIPQMYGIYITTVRIPAALSDHYAFFGEADTSCLAPNAVKAVYLNLAAPTPRRWMLQEAAE